MALPREGLALGDTAPDARSYATWATDADAVARFKPVTMAVDPT